MATTRKPPSPSLTAIARHLDPDGEPTVNSPAPPSGGLSSCGRSEFSGSWMGCTVPLASSSTM
jgi:hypothetical protein